MSDVPITLEVLADRMQSVKGDISSLLQTSMNQFTILNEVKLDLERRNLALKADMRLQDSEIENLKKSDEKQSREIEELKELVRIVANTVNNQQKIMSWAYKMFWALFIPVTLGLLAFIWGVINHQIVISTVP